MMWGCMLYEVIGYGCHIQHIMDADVYCEILETPLKDTLNYWGFSFNNVIFQQDNDPKHTSKKAQKWLDDNEVDRLDWPAQSPDLNPIEHLWHHLKLKLSMYERKAKGIHELWERCDKEWNSITKETCRRYVESMPALVQAVLKAKGGHTNY